MITLQVPIFDEFQNYKFVGFKNVKVKNNIDSKDYNKITNILPGIPQGYCKEIFKIKEIRKPIEVIHFYDIRQNPKKLKGNYITVLD